MTNLGKLIDVRRVSLVALVLIVRVTTAVAITLVSQLLGRHGSVGDFRHGSVGDHRHGRLGACRHQLVKKSFQAIQIPHSDFNINELS